METAKISKKGKGWEISYANGKKMSLTWKNIPDDWDNADILVKRTNGLPALLKNGDVLIEKPQMYVPANNNNNNNYSNYKGKYPSKNADNSVKNQLKSNKNWQKQVDTPRSARTPYNFVPLNKTIIASDVQEVSFERYEKENNTGYIDIKIKNKTHLLVSSGVDHNDPNRTHDFLKSGPDNKIFIPGSSIRGLIKNIVGIVSYSSLNSGEHFDDKPLFYRGVAGGDFVKTYKPLFFSEDNNDYIPQAGYLMKVKNSYVIIPAKKIKDTQYYKVRNAAYIIKIDYETKRPIFNYDGKKFIKYDVRKIYFEPVQKKPHEHKLYNKEKTKCKPYNLKYALVTNYSFTRKNGYIEGNLVITGGLGTKKHDQWIVNEPDPNAKIIELDETNNNVIKDYKLDSQRNEEYDLLNNLSKYSPIPCFFITDDKGTVTSIGHTPLFRVKHSNTISMAVKQDMQNETDIEESIFGNMSSFAGRVFFEDAFLLKNEKKGVVQEKKLIKTLASPKPTSHQLYLRQTDAKKRKTWSNPDIEIAGIKQYWHKNVESKYWEEDNNNVSDSHTDYKPVVPDSRTSYKSEVSDSHTGYIKPVIPDNTFTGRIRFENLSNKELGALLFAIDLPKDCCHKIGLGKPYGLGTIRITPNLVIQNRQERYSKILDNDGKWHLPIKSIQSDFKKEFTEYISKNLGENMDNLWESEHLAPLKAMLEYDKVKQSSEEWLQSTEYMDFKNGFRKREVLDTPQNIKQKFDK